MHIESAIHIKQLFNLCWLYGVCFKGNEIEFSCSGKVDTMTNDVIHCGRYVLQDVGDRYWKLQLTKNQILTFKHPRFDRDEGIYRYHNNNGSTCCAIKYYQPIHILINISGHGKLPLNKLECCTDNASISITHSS